MPTILDVAAKAGVSRSTVSRVLTDSSRVDPATKRRVLAVMAELNYRPSQVARNLRRSQTRMIALLVPDIANPFFGQLVQGVEAVAVRQGYHVILCNTAEDPIRELDYLRMLERKQVDGIILTALRNPPEVIQTFLPFGPVVLAGEYTRDDVFPAVTIDNVAAAAQATEHLIARGHKRIGFINGPTQTLLSADRLSGYRQALFNHGLDTLPELIQTGDFCLAGGRLCAERLLALVNRPTAIFAANDDMAVGAIQAAQARQLRVPEDVAVVGFDDLPVARVVRPQLTTVAQPIHRLGEVAMEWLMLGLMGKAQPSLHRMLPVDLVIRESS